MVNRWSGFVHVIDESVKVEPIEHIFPSILLVETMYSY